MHEKQIVRIIQGAIAHLEKDTTNQYKHSTSNVAKSYLRILMPYAITKEYDMEGKEILVILNREYKPLGVGKGDNVHYQEYPCLISKETLEKIKNSPMKNHTDNPRLITLYHDGNPPWGSRKDLQKYISQAQTLMSALSE